MLANNSTTVAAIIKREASLITVKSCVNMTKCHVAFEADVKQSFLYCNYLVDVLADLKQSLLVAAFCCVGVCSINLYIIRGADGLTAIVGCSWIFIV